MKKKEEKTNVMRVLEQNKIHYISYCYVDTGVISGIDVATTLGQDPAQVFKTLVTVGNSNIDSSAANFDTIIFSGGKIGYQVETSLDELKKVLRFELAELVVTPHS